MWIGEIITSCNSTILDVLEADYLCPCSWTRLVGVAILQGRTEEAIMRTRELLGQGGSSPILRPTYFFDT